MPLSGRPARSVPMARRVDAPGARPRAPWRRPRVFWAAAGLGLLAVSAIGTLNPLSAAGAGSTAGAAPAPSGLGALAGFAGFDVVDLAVKTAIVVALLFVVLRVLGRVGSPAQRPGTMLSVIESRPLAAKASLHLVAVGDRRLVVGLTPAGMGALAELGADELAAAVAADAAAGELAAADAAFGRAAARNATTELRPAIAGRANVPPPAMPLPFSALGPLAGPFDAINGRLATLVAGGRER